MKKIYSFMIAITALPLLMVSAQNLPRDKKPLQGRSAQLEKQKESLKDELKGGLSTEPAGEPSDELNVSEFLLKRNDLKGKIVELTFDRVTTLKQAGKEGYIASVTYESPRMQDGVNIIVPDEGLKFFEELSKPGIVRRETIYIQIVTPSVVKALGTRYRGDEPQGERYRW